MLYESNCLDGHPVLPAGGCCFTEPELHALLAGAAAGPISLVRRPLTQGLELVCLAPADGLPAGRNWPATLFWRHFHPHRAGEEMFITGSIVVCLTCLLP